MEPASLTNISNDLLVNIVDYLDTARDVAHLGAASRRTNHLIRHTGWKSFVQASFPSLRVPSNESTLWDSVADRLTYLDRCWDKRGLQFSLFREARLPAQKNKGGVRAHAHYSRQNRGQSVEYQGVVDARLLSSGYEVVAAGCGEALQVRWSFDGDQQDEIWAYISGSVFGYAPGPGDVTAVKIIERGDAAEIVVGRANGDVQVVCPSLEQRSGVTSGVQSHFTIPLEQSDASHASAFFKSPGRLAVKCIDWHADRQLLVTGRSSILSLYDLSLAADDDDPYPRHVLSQDISASDQGETPFIQDVKFLSKDTIAVALGGCSEPILVGTIGQDSISLSPAASNGDMVDNEQQPHQQRLNGSSAAPAKRKTSVLGIEPVGNGTSRNLLLSSWHDGTFRLADVRTPSAYDAIYQDSFQPYHSGGPLLVYGTERFVTTNNWAPNLRFFDFRYPKPYLHSSALPCSPMLPDPPVKYSNSRSSANGSQVVFDKCVPEDSTKCAWHSSMQQHHWRPDATVWLGDRSFDRVFSLAKAADTSDKFYCGFRGAIIEAKLTLAEETPKTHQRPARSGNHSTFSTLPISMAETGTCLLGNDWAGSNSGMPQIFSQSKDKHGFNREFAEPLERSRLDSAMRLRVAQSSSGRAVFRTNLPLR